MAQEQVQKQVKDTPPAMLAPMLVLWSSHHLPHRSPEPLALLSASES